MNSIELSLFVSRMEAVCEEMGVVLKRTAFSPNIKDRLDFSCALFDAEGELCAQAAHIPVHLGSMAYAMADVVKQFTWVEGDVVVLNDPFLGGTHLPDVTIVAPVFVNNDLIAFAVNRAHHANIGSDSPGSMPNSTSLGEEGIIISPQFLIEQGELNKSLWQALKAIHQDEHSDDLSGDMAAQVSSVKVGVQRMVELISVTANKSSFIASLEQLNAYGQKMANCALLKIPDGEYSFEDYMDDDGQGNERIKIALRLKVLNGNVVADFAGTGRQVEGNINCPISVTAAGVYYVFRCLMPDHTPACAGIFRDISLKAEPGSLVNAQRPAAVVAGNVETSTRIVDVVLGALQQALPKQIPAASQGSMNNIAMGQNNKEDSWDYYETLAGGMGAGPKHPGLNAVHTHMTNTLNTPVESLEMHYPIRIREYSIRTGSGGSGDNGGGEGLSRNYEFLEPTQVSLLTERRCLAPWGLGKGNDGQQGQNILNGVLLAAKTSFQVNAGDSLIINTPGGGGWSKT